MSKYKIINLFDKLFVTITVFLIVYAWINFFIRNLQITFFLSVIFTFGIVFLIFFLYNRKQVKKNNIKSYLKDIEDCFLSFALLSKNSQLCLLNSILAKDCKTRILENSIVLKKNNKTEKFLVLTDKEKVNHFDLLSLLQGVHNVDVVNIICNDFDTTINAKILKNTQVNFINKKLLYDQYFFKHNIYPNKEILNTKVEHKKLKEVAKNFFIPSRAKAFFFSGLILIFSSIILPYHTYYLIFGTTLLIFSLVCKLLPKFRH